MSRPRKPYGAQHPGRLPATMMKVLAAEMSDPQRLRRGKQYARDGSVVDIVVEPGVVTCEVMGSRPTPYVAMLEVRPGDGMPLRRDLTTSCSCPDDDGWQDSVCKHVVAAMFTFSDELLLEPELLDVWRGRGAASNRPAGRHLRLVRDLEAGSDAGPDEAPESEPTAADPLADLLRAPQRTTLPDTPELGREDPDPPGRRDLATVLEDAVNHLRIEWD